MVGILISPFSIDFLADISSAKSQSKIHYIMKRSLPASGIFFAFFASLQATRQSKSLSKNNLYISLVFFLSCCVVVSLDSCAICASSALPDRKNPAPNLYNLFFDSS
jgi:hypothetical protein